MRILYITDIHATAKAPRGRIDNFPQALIAKLNEVGSNITANKIDMVIIGGDLFHSPIISLQFAGVIANILKSWKIPIVAVPGNHDEIGYNVDVINQTMLGLFAQSHTIRLLTTTTPVMCKVGNKLLAIEGREYHSEIDTDPRYYSKSIKADFNIVVAHGMLVNKPFMPGINFTLLKDIPSPANLTLSGHDHVGYGIENINNNIFINPGSFMRVDTGTGMLSHKPKITVIELNDIGNKIDMSLGQIELATAKPYDMIFDINAKIATNNFQNDMVNFVNMVKSINLGKNVSYINEVVNSSLDDSIKNVCVNYLTESEQNNSNSVKNKLVKKPSMHITKIILQNFLSHENTVVDFVNGLNIIEGPNSAGKTSLLYAIEWLVYDTPKGSDFIRTGENNVLVRLEFSDGDYIEKTRTRKTSSVYKIKYNGVENTYCGYGSNLPPELELCHQMPLINLYKDKAVSLNYADQLNGLFLVNATGSEKAEAIGKLTGADIIDGAITNVAKDLKGSQNDLSKLKKEYAIKKKDLITTQDKKLDIDDRLAKSKKLYDDLVKYTDVVSNIDKYIGATSNINLLNGLILDRKDKVLLLDNYINVLDIDIDIFNLVNEYSNTLFNIEDTNNNTAALTNKINAIDINIKEIDLLIETLEKLTKDINFNREILKQSDLYINYEESLIKSRDKMFFDKNKILAEEDLIKDLDKQIEVISYLIKLNGSEKALSTTKEHLSFNKDILINVENSIKTNDKEIHDILHEMGKCPTCNQQLTEDAINTMKG